MKSVVEMLVNNWYMVVALIAVIVVIVTAVYAFFQLPTSKQIEKVKKCLLAWVIEAERELGGGTGKAKLSTVYGMFVTAFPVVKNFISFDTFSQWVDEALDEMRRMLEENQNLKNVIECSNMLISSVEEIKVAEPYIEPTKEEISTDKTE